MACDLDMEGSVGFGHAGKRNSRQESTVGERPRDVPGGVEPCGRGKEGGSGRQKRKERCCGPGEGLDLAQAS